MRIHLAALRLLLVFTVLLGVGYPLAVTAVAQLPGLKERANGSLVQKQGQLVGSRLIGQSFLDSQGNPIRKYFQARPSAAGSTGYDPTATGASNLGPESIVDQLPNPADPSDRGKPSLLTQICARSRAIGELEGVAGTRPYCTADGVGAVLAVFWSGPGYTGQVTRVLSINQTGSAVPFVPEYHGVTVQLAQYGQDYSRAQIVPVRGTAPAEPAVPADAVTASGSGLDPQISPDYARLQEGRVAAARHITVAEVAALVRKYSEGRDLGFLGEPRVNVLLLNLDLDRQYPTS